MTFWFSRRDGTGALSDLGGLRPAGRSTNEDLRVRQQLCDRDRDVARARRHVDEQDVQVAPEHVREELLEGAVKHGAAPDDGLAVGHEHADRDDLDAAGAHGRDHHAVDDLRVVVHAEHARDREAVDVRVHDADLEALRGQRGGQVRGHGGLADAALTGGDGDDAGQGVGTRERDLALGATTVEFFAQRLLLCLVHDAHFDGDVLDAVEGTHTLGDVLRDLGAQRAPGGGEQDLDRDGRAIDRDQVGGSPC